MLSNIWQNISCERRVGVILCFSLSSQSIQDWFKSLLFLKGQHTKKVHIFDFGRRLRGSKALLSTPFFLIYPLRYFSHGAETAEQADERSDGYSPLLSMGRLFPFVSIQSDLPNGWWTYPHPSVFSGPDRIWCRWVTANTCPLTSAAPWRTIGGPIGSAWEMDRLTQSVRWYEKGLR